MGLKEIQAAVDALSVLPDDQKALAIAEVSGGRRWRRRRKKGAKKPGPKPGSKRKINPAHPTKVSDAAKAKLAAKQEKIRKMKEKVTKPDTEDGGDQE